MLERFVVVPSVYVLPSRGAGREEEILLQLRHGTGYMDEHWSFAAAGHVERGESALQAASRETQEVGILVLPAQLESLTTMHRTHLPRHAVDERVDFFFRCRTWTGNPVVLEPAKCAELRWFPLANLPDPVVPHEQLVLDQVGRGALPPLVTFGFPGDAGDGVRYPAHPR